MSPPVEVVFQKTLDVLEAAGIPFAVMGGFAVRVWGLPRPTYDVDLVVGVEPTALDSLLREFESKGFVVPPEHRHGWSDSVAGMRKVGVRLFESGHVWECDLFLASTPFLSTALARRRQVTLENRSVPILSPEDLILLKLVAGRPKDQVDVDEILLVVGSVDLAYLRSWAERLGVTSRLEEALQRKTS